MRAGRRRHRIVINSPTGGMDAAGGNDETPVLFVGLWADVGYASGRERWANEHVVNNYDAVVTINYRTDLIENMTVVHKGRTLDIKNIIDPTMDKVELKLLCVDRNGY